MVMWKLLFHSWLAHTHDLNDSNHESKHLMSPEKAVARPLTLIFVCIIKKWRTTYVLFAIGRLQLVSIQLHFIAAFFKRKNKVIGTRVLLLLWHAKWVFEYIRFAFANKCLWRFKNKKIKIMTKNRLRLVKIAQIFIIKVECIIIIKYGTCILNL